MKRFYLLLLLCTAISLYSSAQIGYQVSLLNNATGEPRANEQVTITVKITDSKGKTVCEETKNETSNDFGVISTSVGNSSTFSNADWSKLPFFIEATVDGRLIGKSQLLSVPVAEYAKKTGILSKELLCSKTWVYSEENFKDKYSFYQNNTYYWESITYRLNSPPEIETSNGTYMIDGNIVSIEHSSGGMILHYNADNNCLIDGDGGLYK